ncbi:MAG: ribosome biogenesis factor YjgA [Lysobacteraceae bacterium]
MRGRDEETGEFLSPSRSQQRREAAAVLELAEALVAQSTARLAQLPLPEGLAEEIERVQRTPSHIARKRQLHFLAKLMRREDEEALDAIRAVLEHDKSEGRREAARLHRAEAWRERLLEDGDSALAELLEAHPEADRQRLRQLVRNATRERAGNKPPHAQRELFRVLRELTAADEG